MPGREEEINSFIPEEYWTLDADFNIAGEKKPLKAKFYGTDKKKLLLHSEEEVNEILEKLKNAEYQVSDVKKGERVKKAPLPFTDQYAAAGSIQSSEFFHPEDHADRSAAL